MITTSSFSKILLHWFEENQRALPWRGETDPYKIWVSEIILQQTRVNQGWDYYLKFIERFPDVKSLANAHLQDVLHVWQGLGYYSRARNMHTAAQQIMQNHHGVFPHHYLEIKKLKGIGNYTAAAIGSIAFNLPYPAVDGNVLRVITRIFGIYEDIAQQKTVRNITQLCEKLMDKESPGTFNQALMEMGAIQCTPKNPNCEVCPFVNQCIAFEKQHVSLLPVKSNKIKIKERFFHYFIFIKEGKTIIEQRTANDIWKNLYQFPMIETVLGCEKSQNLLPQSSQSIFTKAHKVLFNNKLSMFPFAVKKFSNNVVFLKEVKHKLTHQHLSIRFYVVKEYFPELQNNWLIVSMEDLEKYPFPIALAFSTQMTQI